MKFRNSRILYLSLILVFIFALFIPNASDARVVRFVVEQTRPLADGVEWGMSGSYERLDGRAYMEVDPNDPLNAVIVNVDKAPRNSQGKVEFSAPFLILKPVNMYLGNQKLWFGLNNRGNIIEFGYRLFPVIRVNNPLTAADLGDGLPMQLGYTYVDAGWQGDVAPGNDRLFPDLPIATQPDGSPIVALVRIEYSDRTIPQSGTFTLTLEGSTSFRSYETADMDTSHSTLTVRNTVDGTKVPIASDRWAFGSCPGGEATLVPGTTDICLFDRFQADKFYELIYPAKNPMVMGLGYAVMRDIGSFLRYETHDDFGNANPLALSSSEVGIRRAYGSGSSSTGMYMRDWLYLGFNEDESHRKVFDAVHIHIPGTMRLFANVEFADPNTYSRQDSRHDFLSTSYPPFTYAVTTDPVSGIRDGILKRPKTDPLVFHTDSANEFWNFKASLNVTDGYGGKVPIPENVRFYLLSGFPHGGASGLFDPPGPPGICKYPLSSGRIGVGTILRALLVALDKWADQGIEPPKSEYPRVENKTLLPLEEARSHFPAIPDVQFPSVLNELELLDFGSQFNSEGGRLTLLPPALGPSYKILVPKPDDDGMDLAGIRPLDVRAPLGSLFGWNVRAPGFVAPNICGLSGSFIPFATTKAERLANGDPRKSLEERYKNHEGFVKEIKKEARKLVLEGFLLQEDAERYISAAEASDVLR